MLWEVALHPARRSARFGQQASGNEAVCWGDFSENDVLRQHMVTAGTEGKDQTTNTLFHGRTYLDLNDYTECLSYLCADS